MIDAQELRKNLRYEKETGDFWWIVSRPGLPNGRPAGSFMTNGYRKIRMDGANYLSHRLAWLYVHGEWPKHEIDHVDGDPSNNAWSNLRSASHRQNLRNQRISSNNKSGFKGVSWHKAGGRWCAQIKSDDKVVYLGLFDCPREAHAAYCAAGRSLYGEFFNDGAVS